MILINFMENSQDDKIVISFLGTGRLGLLVAESLLKNKYKVKINHQTLERLKNYFR